MRGSIVVGFGTLLLGPALGCEAVASIPDYERSIPDTAVVDTLSEVTDSSSDAADAGACVLIDDMEHGDGTILGSCGRVGYWGSFNDGTTGATQTPGTGVPFTPTAIPGGRGTSTSAANTVGNGFSTWGAGMGFDLHHPGGGEKKSTYDASAWSGIAFFARVGAGSTTSVRLNVADADTDPAGGVCTPDPKCNDHFGRTLVLTASWARYTVLFKDMTQGGFGTSFPAIDPKRLYGIQFQVGAGSTFDLWIDDITFVP